MEEVWAAVVVVGEEEEEVLRNERREWGRGWWLCYERLCGFGGEPFLAIWERERERGRERIWRGRGFKV